MCDVYRKFCQLICQPRAHSGTSPSELSKHFYNTICEFILIHDWQLKPNWLRYYCSCNWSRSRLFLIGHDVILAATGLATVAIQQTPMQHIQAASAIILQTSRFWWVPTLRLEFRLMHFVKIICEQFNIMRTIIYNIWLHYCALQTTGLQAEILSLISMIGCIISIVSLVLTVLLYVAMWK